MKKALLLSAIFGLWSSASHAIIVTNNAPLAYDIEVHVGMWAETQQPAFTLKGNAAVGQSITLEIPEEKIKEIKDYLNTYNQEQIKVIFRALTPQNYSGIIERHVFSIDKNTDLAQLNKKEITLFGPERVEVK